MTPNGVGVSAPFPLIHPTRPRNVSSFVKPVAYKPTFRWAGIGSSVVLILPRAPCTYVLFVQHPAAMRQGR
jgi:uncharacterized membrane protein YukC